MLLLISLAHALDPADASALAAGEVVLHELPPVNPGAVRVEGLVDIDAPFEAVWSALLDFKARLVANHSLKDIAYYRPSTPTEEWVSWTAASFGFSLTYHNHYILHHDEGVLIHELDPSQTNDMKASYGIYRLSHSPRGTLLDYDVESDFGISIPDVVKKWLTNRAIRDFLEDIAARSHDGDSP